MFVALI